MKLNGRISIFINKTETIIEILDENANIQFAKITLTPDQLSSALSRLSRTECNIDVFGLDKIGKKHENKKFVFQMPEDTTYENRNKVAYATALYELQKRDMTEWEPDNYFNSQDSFFKDKDKQMASCTIRRWV